MIAFIVSRPTASTLSMWRQGGVEGLPSSELHVTNISSEPLWVTIHQLSKNSTIQHNFDSCLKKIPLYIF